jgi:hypothetical protein
LDGTVSTRFGKAALTMERVGRNIVDMASRSLLNLKLAYGLYLDKVGNMPPVAIAKGIVDAAA